MNLLCLSWVLEGKKSALPGKYKEDGLTGSGSDRHEGLLGGVEVKSNVEGQEEEGNRDYRQSNGPVSECEQEEGRQER